MCTFIHVYNTSYRHSTHSIPSVHRILMTASNPIFLVRYRLRKRQLLEVHIQRPVRRCLLTWSPSRIWVDWCADCGGSRGSRTPGLLRTLTHTLHRQTERGRVRVATHIIYVCINWRDFQCKCTMYMIISQLLPVGCGFTCITLHGVCVCVCMCVWWGTAK